MLHTVTVRALTLAACAWLLACDAAALGVGTARGAVLIGRPLDLAIPITLDAAGDPCAGAELFYGERRPAAPPTVRWQQGRGAEGVLHVSSQAPVNEPMVTLDLRIGCTQPSTRRYVLLANPPPADDPAPVAASPIAPVAAAPREQAAPTPKPSSPPKRAAPRAPTKEAAARPRLRLEPLDLTIEHDPVLRLTPELATQPLSDPQQRQALAALWRRIQGGPDLAVQDAQRLQAVQRELELARDRTRSDAAAVAQLRAQVDETRSSRDAASRLAIVLGAVLALLLAVLAWRWYRMHQVERVARWFEAQGSAATPGVDIPVGPAEPAVATPAPLLSVPAPLPEQRSAPARPAVPAVASAWGAGDDFQVSRNGSLRMVGVQELIDVHDKADFFLSIGEPEQAVGLLEAHVRDPQVETGALAWMDLLELYHRLGKRAPYDRLRAEFRQRFTAQVPDFDHFDQPTPSLENYSRALSRIVALWPSQRVLDVIEESIFRKPGLPGAEPFSLEAYRELVLLYHVARDLGSPQQEDEGITRPARSDTTLQPLNALDAPEPTQADRERLMIPPASPHLGVDIDLGQASSELAALDFDFSAYDEAEPAERKRS